MRPLLCAMVLVLGQLGAGCGGSSGGYPPGGGGGSWAARCSVACTAPTSGPCAGQSSTQCVSDCVALTGGLSLACVQCMVEHSGWIGIHCVPNCPSCCPCGFGPGTHNCAGGTGCSCSAADEKCSGFQLAKATGSDCAAACGYAPDGGLGNTHPAARSGVPDPEQ